MTDRTDNKNQERKRQESAEVKDGITLSQWEGSDMIRKPRRSGRTVCFQSLKRARQLMPLLLFALVNLVHDIFNQTFQTNFYFSVLFCLFILYQRTLGHLYIKGNETSVTQRKTNAKSPLAN